MILGLRSVTNRRRWNPVRFLDVVNGHVVRHAHFQCSLDGKRWRRCNSTFNAASPHQGENSVSVRAAPANGIAPPPVSASWLVVFTPPQTAITAFSVSPTASNVLIATFNAVDRAGVSSYACQLDGARWKACTSPYTTPALGVGRHVFEVRALDRAGNRQRRPTILRFWVR
jgi:hypothetical protein